MSAAKIIVATALVLWCINTIILMINEPLAIIISCGIIFPIIMIVAYPYRAWRTYSSSINYYRKNGVSRARFILCKGWRDDLKGILYAIKRY